MLWSERYRSWEVVGRKLVAPLELAFSMEFLLLLCPVLILTNESLCYWIFWRRTKYLHKSSVNKYSWRQEKTKILCNSHQFKKECILQIILTNYSVFVQFLTLRISLKNTTTNYYISLLAFIVQCFPSTRSQRREWLVDYGVVGIYALRARRSLAGAAAPAWTCWTGIHPDKSVSEVWCGEERENTNLRMDQR